jgi:hypothetical protein
MGFRRGAALAAVIAFGALLIPVQSAAANERAAAEAPAVPSTSYSYTADPTTPLVNPERGFYVDSLSLEALDPNVITEAQKDGDSLIHGYGDLSAYTGSGGGPTVIDQSWLDGFNAAMQQLRENGLKVVLRFSYSPHVPADARTGCPADYQPTPGDNVPPDAPLAVVLAQIQQLAPYLAQNDDVISSIEAGFVGEWGEWHCSTNQLTEPANEKAIMDAELAAFPADRQIAMRYPTDIFSLEPGYADPTSRIGNHQDCYASSVPDDKNTWYGDAQQIADEKAQIGVLGVDHVVGATACGLSARTTCPIALTEMPEMHFSYMTGRYNPDALQAYADGGCLGEITNDLGYRLQLDTATLPSELSPGDTGDVSIGITNTGWSALFNSRPVDLRFAAADGSGNSFVVPLNADPRSWKSGMQVTVAQSVTIPADTAPGTYTVSLWLPDESQQLQGDPRYSVRFANANVWDAASGSNLLGQITVTAASAPAANPTVPNSAPVLANTGVDESGEAAAALLATIALCAGGVILAVVRVRRRRTS